MIILKVVKLFYPFYGYLLILLVAGVTYAAFTDSGKVLGSSFTVNGTDLKLLSNLKNGSEKSNIVDSLPGPAYTNITDGWTAQFPVKVFNNGAQELLLASNSDYQTANDPANLRQLVLVEPFVWDDKDGNGVVAESEVGTSLGKKTIVKWKTEGFDFGKLKSGEIRGFVLEFSASGITASKQGTTGVFDYEFTGTTIE